jgi:hypothetical protein
LDRHGAALSQAMMAWAVANVRVESKGDTIIITKQASGSAKIDPLMAASNAIALMSTNPWSTGQASFHQWPLLILPALADLPPRSALDVEPGGNKEVLSSMRTMRLAPLLGLPGLAVPGRQSW